MKNLRLTLLALLGFVAVTGVHAADKKDDSASRVDVTFENPENFVDAADGPRGSDIGRDANLTEIKNYLVRRAASQLQPGQHLSVTITGLDFAGEIEPWRTGAGSDIRIVKQIYAPAIDLTYRLTDASGAVIKEGKSQLRDMNFMSNADPIRSDPRFYENALIDTWVRRELSKAAQKK